MDELKELFNRYKEIIASYEGEKTDWNLKVDQLASLSKDIEKSKISRSKNQEFYLYIKHCLQKDVAEERARLNKNIWRLKSRFGN